MGGAKASTSINISPEVMAKIEELYAKQPRLQENLIFTDADLDLILEIIERRIEEDKKRYDELKRQIDKNTIELNILTRKYVKNNSRTICFDKTATQLNESKEQAMQVYACMQQKGAEEKTFFANEPKLRGSIKELLIVERLHKYCTNHTSRDVAWEDWWMDLMENYVCHPTPEKTILERLFYIAGYLLLFITHSSICSTAQFILGITVNSFINADVYMTLLKKLYNAVLSFMKREETPATPDSLKEKSEKLVEEVERAVDDFKLEWAKCEEQPSV